LEAAQKIEGIEVVDLYEEYPRFNIDIDLEQQKLLGHDLALIQCPLFWYSTPSLVKAWQDLVLEQCFAYGHGGDRLQGKRLMFALTAAGSAKAYTEQGYQHYPLRTFLTPVEQTARLSKMGVVPPYVLFDSLKAPNSDAPKKHVEGYAELLKALRITLILMRPGRSPRRTPQTCQ
jgi:putative NADPH-quinone reductase